MADKIKFAIAVLLVVAGIAAFYMLGETAVTVRVLCVLGGIAAGAAVGWTTEPGKQFAEFAIESWRETRKVVWPTRKETIQTTGAVFAFVMVMALVLFTIDKGVETVVYNWILGIK